jgi:hypothetical protein
MSAIPLHIQRRFEQRWAARFVRPVALISPKGVVLKPVLPTSSPHPQAKEKGADVSQLSERSVA